MAAVSGGELGAYREGMCDMYACIYTAVRSGRLLNWVERIDEAYDHES